MTLGKENPYISTAVAARDFFFISVSSVKNMCAQGQIRTARKKTPNPRSPWIMSRLEVIQICSKLHKRET